MAELFGVTQQNISYHLSQIEESGELHLSDAYKKNCYLRTNGLVSIMSIYIIIKLGKEED